MAINNTTCGCPACGGSDEHAESMMNRIEKVLDMLDVVRDLPGPCSVTISGVRQGCGMNQITAQFGPEPGSAETLVQWAMRFSGAVLQAGTIDYEGRPTRRVCVEFSWRGTRASAFAYIPLPEEPAECGCPMCEVFRTPSVGDSPF